MIILIINYKISFYAAWLIKIFINIALTSQDTENPDLDIERFWVLNEFKFIFTFS